MNIEEKLEKAKIIGIGNDGINTLNSIKFKLENNMDIEEISINQDVDKDYVRELLDGVDLLFLTYNSEDKKALQIVNAIGYMADERRILSIGIDSSNKENKDEVNINREFKVDEASMDKFINLVNMLVESISYQCMINLDLTDLKETLCTDGGIKYSYKEFGKDISKEDMVRNLLENVSGSQNELLNKKQIIFIEMGSNYCKEDEMIFVVNDILTIIKEKSENSCDSIFSLYVKEQTKDKIKIGLVCN